MTQMRRALKAHLAAWRKQVPAAALSASYPGLSDTFPDLVPEMFDVFWAALERNVQVPSLRACAGGGAPPAAALHTNNTHTRRRHSVQAEFDDICGGAHIAERLADLETLLAEADGKTRPTPLAVAPEVAVRGMAVDAKLEYARNLEKLAAQLKRKNDELEADAFRMAATARDIKARLAAQVDTFHAVRWPAGAVVAALHYHPALTPPTHTHTLAGSRGVWRARSQRRRGPAVVRQRAAGHDSRQLKRGGARRRQGGHVQHAEVWVIVSWRGAHARHQQARHAAGMDLPAGGVVHSAAAVRRHAHKHTTHTHTHSRCQIQVGAQRRHADARTLTRTRTRTCTHACKRRGDARYNDTSHGGHARGYAAAGV